MWRRNLPPELDGGRRGSCWSGGCTWRTTTQAAAQRTRMAVGGLPVSGRAPVGGDRAQGWKPSSPGLWGRTFRVDQGSGSGGCHVRKTPERQERPFLNKRAGAQQVTWNASFHLHVNRIFYIRYESRSLFCLCKSSSPNTIY